MANALYPKGKKKILDGDIDLLVDDIRVAAIDTADEAYNAADEFYSDLTAAGVIAVASLSGKTTTDGVFDASNTTLPTVSGDPFEALVFYKWTGSGATSPLIGWMDITQYTPTGVDVLIIWHASGIFAI